jgi:hypothetical protein
VKLRSGARGILGAIGAAGAAFLVGCGSASHANFVANACGGAGSGVALKLVLSNVAPTPQVGGSSGATVEVVSSSHGNEMTFPAAHPSSALCEISQHRTSDGTAMVVYKALRPGAITFSSTYTHATQAMMPAMLGRLVVAR